MTAFDSRATPSFPAGGDRLAHVGFVVRDIDKELKRWVGAGARLFIAPEIDPLQKVWCALIGFPETLPIELVAPVAGETSPIEARLKRGGGLDHICYFVDDVGAALADFEERGGVVVVSPIYGSVFDRMIAFLQMRTGLIVELMSASPIGRKPADPLQSYYETCASPITHVRL